MGDEFVIRACVALHAKDSMPIGALYCFRDVNASMTDGYMVRDQTNRLLLNPMAPFIGRHAAHESGQAVCKMPPNDGETIWDVDCRLGITWGDIRLTDGLTHDELMAKLT